MFKIKIKETTWNRVDAFGDHVRWTDGDVSKDYA